MPNQISNISLEDIESSEQMLKNSLKYFYSAEEAEIKRFQINLIAQNSDIHIEEL